MTNNPKRQIDTLLKAVCDWFPVDAMPPELDRAACAVQDALGDGVFDVLVDHPGDEHPPDKDGRYLVLWNRWDVPVWDIQFWMAGKWQVHSEAVILKWRELPEVTE